MKLIANPLVLALLISVALPLAACDEKKGPAEKAGSSIDKAAHDAKDAIDPPGPAQKAGRAVDSAVNDTK